MKNTNNIQEKNCTKSDCACADKKNMAQQSETQKEVQKVEQDPTRFGDWQVNGRAIDF